MKLSVRYCAFSFTFILIVLFITLYAKLEFFRTNGVRELLGTAVFFMETNVSRRHLSEVSACSVESAAKHHPRSPIIFYKIGTAFDPDSPLLLSLRRHYPNIRFEPLDPSQLFRGTPLQDANGSGDEMLRKIWNSPYPLDHMSDVARVALLWKHGGIYLDTDVVVRRPLDTLANSMGREVEIPDRPDLSNNAVNTHVMAFERKSGFLYKYMVTLKYIFTSITYNRIAPGPNFISIMLLLECGVLSPAFLPLNAPEKCGGINVFPVSAYNTVNYFNAFKLFEFPKNKALNLTEARVVHLSHSRVKGNSTAVGSGTYLDVIFKENCPVVYEQIRGSVIYV